jgi:hypothetical protein
MHDHSNFLKLPTDEERKECYRRYYEATSNAAVAMGVCAICGREVGIRDDKLSLCPLDTLPNCERLQPRIPHLGHDLFDGCLMEPRGVVTRQGKIHLVKACGKCLKDMESKRDGPPPLSLANNMWIGRVPWELETLTCSERLLIALLYPRVFVFKLFPKQLHGRPEEASLQRAMRGTVSSYDMDVEGVAAMVEGRLMPRPTAILASVISVTLFGRGTPQKHWLRGMFRVRRRAVLNLVWLKANNPKYYGDIEISDQRLADLPEDDIPIEILDIVRHSEDVGSVIQESAGYVPVDEEKGQSLV